jgi:anaerobic selenocysteine-containing dehydrogenase
MVLWGNDLLNTYLHDMSRDAFRAALLNGAKLVVIDVKKIDIAKRADMWLRPRPASDGALAMGIIKVMVEERLYDEDFVAKWTIGFDKLREHVKTFTLDDVEKRTWVPQQQIKEFARLYAEFQPAQIQMENALHQSINWFQCARAINIIRGLSGKVNCPGGDILYKPRSAVLSPGRFVFPKDIPAHREMSKVLGSEYKMVIQNNSISREVLIKTILEEKPYPIKAVLFLLTNPLVSYTNTQEVYRAFMKLDFIAGAELFPTPTTAIADIVLPATWGAEMETMSYFGGGGPKLIEPPGEAWPDTKWINELGKRIGLPGWWNDDKEAFDLILKPTGITWEEFKKQGAPPVAWGEGEYKKPEEGIFTTPSGKAEIYSERLKELGYSPMPNWQEISRFRFEPSEEYPLLMTNGKEAAYYLTGYKHIAGLRRKTPQPIVEVHPDTAKRAGLKEGDWVYIETKTGKIKQILSLNPDLDPRVIFAAFGWWFPEEPEDLYQFRKSNINVLTDSDPPYDPQQSNPELRGIPCRVFRVEDKEHRKDYMAQDEQ